MLGQTGSANVGGVMAARGITFFEQAVATAYSCFFQAEDGIRYHCVTGVQTCALPISEGARFDEFPYHQSILHTAEAEYEELPGFEGDITRARSVAELPRAARDYVDAIAEYSG